MIIWDNSVILCNIIETEGTDDIMENIHTDLALEEQERFKGTQVEISGVELEKHKSKSGIVQITTVRILNEQGANTMRKPIGNYITLEECMIEDYDQILYDEIAEEITEQLCKMIKNLSEFSQNKKVIVVGLGNRDATPDALGPSVINDIVVGKRVMAVAPGVMAQTGLETADYVRGIAKESGAGIILAIDSLAARNTERLNTTIQITDTGINPGSGVGNHRQAINRETMGIPVIAIGVPTVVDAATIVNDVMDNLICLLEENFHATGLSKTMSEFNQNEKRELVKELMHKNSRDLYVTPKDIDENIAILAEIISCGMNDALERLE